MVRVVLTETRVRAVFLVKEEGDYRVGRKRERLKPGHRARERPMKEGAQIYADERGFDEVGKRDPILNRVNRMS